MVKGDLVRINKNTLGSTYIGYKDLLDEEYLPVNNGELGIYLSDYVKHGFHKIIFIFSLQKTLCIYHDGIEPLKKEQ